MTVPESWFVLPKLLLLYVSKIGALGLSVYVVLTAYADDDYACTLHPGAIAHHLSCSNSDIVRILNLLEDHQLIRIERTRSKSIYHLLWKTPAIFAEKDKNS
jgi:DNA-binding MarR family transcriptional regulator